MWFIAAYIAVERLRGDPCTPLAALYKNERSPHRRFGAGHPIGGRPMPDLPSGSKHLPHDCTTRLNDLLRGVVSAEILALIFEIVDEVADRAHEAGHEEGVGDTR